MRKIKLSVLGISYSQTQSGAYALVLSEEEGDRRIPIIIGAFEAQSIAIHLEGLKPPRPLTHDLFRNFADIFKIKLKEINIYKLEEGVFFSNLVCLSESKEFKIDARTSDAIALALRFSCPIYTTEDIMNKAGIIVDINFDKEKKSKTSIDEDPFIPTAPEKIAQETEYSGLPLEELEELLKEAVEREDYEKASLLRDEINKRKRKKANL